MATQQTIAAMSVRISAQTQELQQGLEKAGGTINKFQNQFSGMGGLGGAIAGAFAVGSVLSFGREIITLNGQVQGVKYAFDKLNQPGLLDQLRTATKGTVDDFGLMKAAVNAKNFKIPLDQLATLLTFARRRAQETGQSVDMLTEKIIEGLGKQSTEILDVLGVSVKDVREEFKKTGDFGKAFGTIVTQELGKMGPEIETTADRIARMNASWENLKTTLGAALIPVVDTLLTKLNGFTENIKKAVDNDIISSWQKWGLILTNQGDKIIQVQNTIEIYKKDIDSMAAAHTLNNQTLEESLEWISKSQFKYTEIIKQLREYGAQVMANSKLPPPGGAVVEMGVLETLKKQLADQQALKEKASAADIASFNIEIKNIQEKIAYYEKLGTVVGKVNVLEDKINTLKKQQNEATRTIDYQRIGRDIDNLQNKLDALKASSEPLPRVLSKAFDTKSMLPKGTPSLGDSTQLAPVTIKLAPVDTTAYEESLLNVQDFNVDIAESIKASLLDLTLSITESFGQMIASADVDWSGVILGGFGSMLEQLGVQVLKAAASLLVIKLAFSSMNPYAMAAAGLALVALGAGLKASATKIASGGSGGGASTSGMASSSVGNSVSASTYAPNLNDASKQNNINVMVTGKLAGKDLVLVMDRSNDSLKRVG